MTTDQLSVDRSGTVLDVAAFTGVFPFAIAVFVLRSSIFKTIFPSPQLPQGSTRAENETQIEQNY